MKNTFIFKSLLLAVLLCAAGVVDVCAKGTSALYAYVGRGKGSCNPACSSSSSQNVNDWTVTAYPSTGYHFSSWEVQAGGFERSLHECSINWERGNQISLHCKWADLTATWRVGSATRYRNVYAYFDPNNYTIWSDARGGSNGFGTVNTTYDKSNYSSWGKASRTGYTFLGWYDNPDGGKQVYNSNGQCTNNTGYWSGNNWVYDGNLTIYAHWQANNYTITFDAQGGTCGISSSTVTYDDTTGCSVSGYLPTRTGYTFAGWWTAASGGTQVYDANGTRVAGDYFNENYQWKHAGNLTVYAHWTANQYIVTYDKNADDATCSESSKSVTYDAAYGTLPTPVRDQYSFAGWFTGREDGDKVESTTKVAVTADQTLYAHWSKRVTQKQNPDGTNTVEFINHGTTTNKDIQENMDKVDGDVYVVDLTKVENMENPDDIINVVRNSPKSTPNTLIIVKDDVTLSDDNKENVLFMDVESPDDTTYTCTNFSVTDGVNLSIPHTFTAEAATYIRSNSSRWGTICVPFELTSNDRIQYYTSGTKYGESLVLNKAATVEAGKPAIYCVSGIEGSNTGDINITHYKKQVLTTAGESGDAATIKLVGSFTELEIDDSNAATLGSGCDIHYYLDNTFYKRASDQTVTIPALRAYILISTAQ